MAKRNTKILSKEDLLHPKSIRKELVEVPSLGGSVYIRQLSGLGLLQYRQFIDSLNVANLSTEQSLSVMTYLISLTACDETGNPLFTQEEAKQLLNNDLNTVEFLSRKALEVSGVSPKAIDEAKNNLKNAQASSPSTVVLPENSTNP